MTTTSETTASLPSEPIASAIRSRPGLSSAPPALPMALPKVTTSPSIVTARTDTTLWIVSPYFRQCTPPEFSLTLPPIVQAICEEGSGA